MSTLMTGAGLLALSTGFAAAAPAVVQQDLNLRAGPGIDYDVVAAMPSGATVDVMGCQAGWCRVAFGGTTGFASRGYLGLGGGVAVGPAYSSYGVAAGPAYGGYEVGYASGGYAPAYGNDVGVSYGGYSPGYTYGSYGAPAYRERFGVREGERTFGNERRFGEQASIRGEGSADVNVRGNSERRATAIKGNNPMRIRESSAASNQSRAQGRAEAIKGNNPMRIREGSAASNQSRAQGQAQSIGGNNPMRVRASTTGAGNASATTGAAPRENRRSRGNSY